MDTTPYSPAQLAALNASLGKLLEPGWKDDATIREAVESTSARGNDMIELGIAVPDGRGGERFYKDYLTNTPRGAQRLHNACEAVGALDRYNARSISASDFVGHTVRVKIGVEKKRGYAPRNIIEDYAASDARVVGLREVAS
jgi:hypothetical protein